MSNLAYTNYSADPGRIFDAPDIPKEVIDEYTNLLLRILAIPDTGEPRTATRKMLSITISLGLPSVKSHLPQLFQDPYC